MDGKLIRREVCIDMDVGPQTSVKPPASRAKDRRPVLTEHTLRLYEQVNPINFYCFSAHPSHFGANWQKARHQALTLCIRQLVLAADEIQLFGKSNIGLRSFFNSLFFRTFVTLSLKQ